MTHLAQKGNFRDIIFLAFSKQLIFCHMKICAKGWLYSEQIDSMAWTLCWLTCGEEETSQRTVP